MPGNIWLFGGLGLDSVGTRSAGSLSGGLPNGTSTTDGALLNDLWKFNTATRQWTWISGGAATGLANQTGVYGTAQVAAAHEFPRLPLEHGGLRGTPPITSGLFGWLGICFLAGAKILGI